MRSTAQSSRSPLNSFEPLGSPEATHRAGCLACGCRLRRPLHEKDGYRYVACLGCGLAHLDPIPSQEHARDVFGPRYFEGGTLGGYLDYVADEELHRENARLRLQLIARRCGIRHGRLLDIGCAHGFFLDEARRLGWSVLGVEISEPAAAYARERLSLPVVTDLQDVATRYLAAFDVVSFHQVLEHVPRPDRTLARARRCLAPRGVLVVETWDRQSAIARAMGRHWQNVAPPSTIWLYDRFSLPQLLRRSGFLPAPVSRTAKYVTAGFAGSLLDTPHAPRAIALLGRLLHSRMFRARRIRYRLGDLVTTMAVRDDFRVGRG